MRIAILSDTHLPRGRRAIPEAALDLMAGSDLIVHAGDISTAEVLEQIRALGPPVHAVHGNADSPELRDALPATLEIELPGPLRLAVVHNGGPAAGRLARLRRRFPDAAAIVFGHSHVPLHEEDAGVQIFNPGSASDRRRQPEHTIGVAEVAEGRIGFRHVSLGP